MQEWNDDIQVQMDRLYSLIDACQGWAWEQKVEEVSDKLHLDGTRLMSELSGGNKKRVALRKPWFCNRKFYFFTSRLNHLIWTRLNG
jgi:ATP-binding cassette subfamily F protein uup